MFADYFVVNSLFCRGLLQRAGCLGASCLFFGGLRGSFQRKRVLLLCCSGFCCGDVLVFGCLSAGQVGGEYETIVGGDEVALPVASYQEAIRNC